MIIDLAHCHYRGHLSLRHRNGAIKSVEWYTDQNRKPFFVDRGRLKNEIIVEDNHADFVLD